MQTIKYTIGFVFNADMAKVALALKQRPDWQKGRLNGIGGKIETGESAVACMVREAREETALATKEEDWTHVALLRGPDWTADVFATAYRGAESDLKTTTDEEIRWHEVKSLPDIVLSNVPWLVRLSLDKLKGGSFQECVVTYPSNTA